ncbi:MAG: TPM domain-containing protein [Chitinophagaceae bacterium]|nr:TPM domain-containing protein [Chitinophagaceae bacterium]
MLSFFRKKKQFFPEEESRLIVKAIRHAEQRTSGEVRVYVESRCSWMDALDRAAEIFHTLKMENTEHRNATLVYVAIKDRQVAVYGDKGIHERVGTEYWNKVVGEMLTTFKTASHGKAIADCVIQIGEALQTHFPYERDTDKNELPDEIVFGR